MYYNGGRCVETPEVSGAERIRDENRKSPEKKKKPAESEFLIPHPVEPVKGDSESSLFEPVV